MSHNTIFRLDCIKQETIVMPVNEPHQELSEHSIYSPRTLDNGEMVASSQALQTVAEGQSWVTLQGPQKSRIPAEMAGKSKGRIVPGPAVSSRASSQRQSPSKVAHGGKTREAAVKPSCVPGRAKTSTALSTIRSAKVHPMAGLDFRITTWRSFSSTSMCRINEH